MTDLREYRLLPVPTPLDDPRWWACWRRKPLVYDVSEDQARGSAARFFAARPRCGFVGFPWDDPALVVCLAREIPAEARAGAQFGAVRDIGGNSVGGGEHNSDGANSPLGHGDRGV